MPKLRNFICGMMACIFPLSASYAQSGPAVLYTQGGVWLNGMSPPAVIALFPGDMVQTDRGWPAKLTASGSAATIQPESLVRFEGSDLRLDHGSVAVDTSVGLAVRVGCLTIVPVRTERTQYEVTDVDGKVSVVARKDDVNINRNSRERRTGENKDHAESVTVLEGEQRDREDKCAAAAIEHPAVAGIKGPILNSAWAKGTGLAGIGVVACWVLCRGDDPLSPHKP